MILKIIKSLIKKIKQAHCQHKWNHGKIAQYEMANPFLFVFPGQLVTSDMLGKFCNDIKICKKCGISVKVK